MNLSVQIEFPDELWSAVSRSYESANYQGAILDGVVALATAIREKTGLDGDGVALVGKAFGGETPLLKVNRLRTESEQNEQRGIETILRGVFQGVRNPRAHARTDDDRQTCDAILTTVAWLWAIVDRAGMQFAKENLLARVLDPDFVETEEYADLLVQEIPESKVFDVCVALFDRRGETRPGPFAIMLKSLEKRLSPEQRHEMHSLASEILQTTNEDGDVRRLLSAFSGDRWVYISKTARLRIENRLIRSIGDGRYDVQKNRVAGGALGTWITSISPHMEMKLQYRHQLLRKLRTEDYEELEYVFRWFRNEIVNLDAEPEPELLRAIEAGLRRGDRRFYDLADVYVVFGDLPEKITEAYEKFEEKNLDPYQADDPF